MTASDISASAVESARRLAASEQAEVNFLVDDVLDSRLDDAFDLILDRGVFHCFPEVADQQAYLATVRRLLKPGGLLLLKCFHLDETCEMGPPCRYDETDIQQRFADGFDLITFRASRFGSPDCEESPKALFCILKKPG